MEQIRRALRVQRDAGRTAGEEGQGLVEYALILLFVAIALFGSVTLFGTSLSTRYDAIAAAIPSL